VTADPQEIYRRYLMASAFSRDPDAVAGMFTDDGVLEAPLVPPADASVFIAEIDTVLVGPAGTTTTMSLVQIFRTRDGKIAMMRDYFAPEHVT
jgi:hypothetical protein